MTTVARPVRRIGLLALLAFTLIATLVTVSAPAHAQKVKAPFFGMHDTQIVNGSVPTVKVGSIRLWDTGTRWVDIETQAPTSPLLPGQPVQRHYDGIGKLDAAVTNAQNAGLRPLVVLGQTPSYYASAPSGMPNDLSAWTDYVSFLASRYGTSVDYQIWNEPNISQFWSGTPAQMATLTAAASRTLDSVLGSQATVVAPGFPLRMKYQRTWFKQYWAQKVSGNGMASYVDVVALHLYPLAGGAPETSMTLLKQARSALPDAARKKPEWNTEVNYGLESGGTGGSKDISNAKQAAYVARTLLLNAGSPIRRMYWYSWADPIGNTRLAEADRTTLTRAGKAWQRVSQDWMIGTKFGSCSVIKSGKSKGVWTCKAKKSRKETRRFYWKPSGRAASISTVKTARSWTELKGRPHKRKGSYTIKVGQSPIMVTSRR
jgi:hypothetical protein